MLCILGRTSWLVAYLGERALLHFLLAIAEHVGRRVESYAGDPANTPFKLAIGARRSLTDLGTVRTRWLHATATTPPP
ncbi:hypothetical protein [Streptomyces sp. NPDC001292]|uniref:hypothetical protein n=1 Tax=Streptomyces sp. NPDC001292 TaxID=3364558 RepID=UPI00369F07F6